jgi:hypothetical protein
MSGDMSTLRRKFSGHSEHSAVSTPKVSHVMCKCKDVSHGLLDHLEHLILRKASIFHIPLDSTVFLYSISKDEIIKSL